VSEAIKLLEAMAQKIAGGAWNLRDRKDIRYCLMSLQRMSSDEMWSGEALMEPSFKKRRTPDGTKPEPPKPPTQA
jgi:hypothetical protein